MHKGGYKKENTDNYNRNKIGKIVACRFSYQLKCTINESKQVKCKEKSINIL